MNDAQMVPISNDKVWNLCFNYLRDPSVSEVQANGHDQFFVKVKGQRRHVPELSYATNEEYVHGIEHGLVPFVNNGKTPWDPESYLFEGPLRYSAGGELIRGRCHIVLSPASDAPQITIAKKATSLATLESIASRGSMSTEMMHFLEYAVKAELNIVLSGGTGAGKTTLLEALTKLMPDDVRIGVAEDTPELVLAQKNVAYLHSVPWRPGMDEKDVASLSWVVAQFQRMRTDKLIIGETRGKEFSDFLTAANSGMDGSMTTIHANTPNRALDKMTSFALRGSPNQPVRSISMDIATSIDLVLQLTLLPDGRHRVAAIQEITDTIGSSEAASITTAALYTYKPESDTWVKNGNPSDALRKRMIAGGTDPAIFSSVDANAQLQPHGRTPGPAATRPATPLRGLPTTRTRGV